MMGDGEQQEGSVWEAAMSASQFGLDNIVAIVGAFEQAKAVKGRPVCILAATHKGKGVSFMEDKAGWHGIATTTREQLDQALADISGSVKIADFEAKHPERKSRVYSVGIAEQNMVNVACGLARETTPIVTKPETPYKWGVANAIRYRGAQGQRVYPFHLGDMNIRTPENMIEAAHKAMLNGKTGDCSSYGIDVPDIEEGIGKLKAWIEA